MTSTAVTHRVRPVAIYLGGFITVRRWRIEDNLGRLVGYKDSKDAALVKAGALSEPKPDE